MEKYSTMEKSVVDYKRLFFQLQSCNRKCLRKLITARRQAGYWKTAHAELIDAIWGATSGQSKKTFFTKRPVLPGEKTPNHRIPKRKASFFTFPPDQKKVKQKNSTKLASVAKTVQGRTEPDATIQSMSAEIQAMSVKATNDVSNLPSTTKSVSPPKSPSIPVDTSAQPETPDKLRKSTTTVSVDKKTVPVTQALRRSTRRLQFR